MAKVIDPKASSKRKSIPRMVKVTTTCVTYVPLDTICGIINDSGMIPIKEDMFKTSEDLADCIRRVVDLDQDIESLAHFAWEGELINTDGGFELDVEIVNAKKA